MECFIFVLVGWIFPVYLWGLFIAFWYVPEVGHAFWSVIGFITDSLNIDSDLIWAGWREFRFWKRI